jgi:hypothetical protein
MAEQMYKKEEGAPAGEADQKKEKRRWRCYRRWNRVSLNISNIDDVIDTDIE